MKAIFLFCAVIFSSTLYGQGVKNNTLNFEYIQAPIIKLDQSWTYSVNVIQSNASDIMEKKKAFEEKQKYYDDEFNKKMEAYNNSKAAGKLIMGKPTRQEAKPNFIGALVDGPSLAQSMINLDGFESSSTGQFIIDIKLGGFAIVSSEKVTDDKKNKIYYKTTYRNPYVVEVKNASDNSVIWSKSFGESSREHKSLERSSDQSSYEMEKEWKENKLSLLKGLEDEVIKEDMKQVNEAINDQLGYPTKSQKIKFYSAKGKKFDYSDINESINVLKKAFLTYTKTPDKSHDYFTQAVTTWEKELETKDVDNKKARIGKKIATGLYINLAFVHTILKNYDKANEYYLEAETIKPLRFASEVAELKEFIAEFEKRNN